MCTATHAHDMRHSVAEMGHPSMASVRQLVVGSVDGDSAVLSASATSSGAPPDVVRVPLALLPDGVAPGARAATPSLSPRAAQRPSPPERDGFADVRAGQVLDMTIARNVAAEERLERDVRDLQATLQARLGSAATLANLTS